MLMKEYNYILERDMGLEIYSEPDEGTTVRIHMPCVDFYEIRKREEDK